MGSIDFGIAEFLDDLIDYMPTAIDWLNTITQGMFDVFMIVFLAFVAVGILASLIKPSSNA